MDERVLNLLSLCLTAKKQGVPVWFNYSSHIDLVQVYSYKEGWETTPPDETPDREFNISIYLDWGDAENRIVEAEQAIKNLIKERGKSE